MYYAKIWLNDVLVRDFVAVIRMGDNKPGMYDKKNRVFYTNAGTGEFTYPEPTLTKPLVTRLIAGGYVASIYKPLNYLQGTGTQYIDTEFIPTQNTKTSVDFELTDVPSDTYATLFGCTNGNTYSGYAFYLNNTVNMQARTGLNTNTNIVSTYPVAVGRYTVSLKFNELTINDNTFIPTSLNTWQELPQSMYLFNCRSPSVDGNRRIVPARIYSCKVWYNNTLVRDFVPVLRTLDNKPGMYDRINGVFYTNAGTGEFTYA